MASDVSSRYPTLLHVVGARPNFVKIAPLLRALRERGGSRSVLVHTGQHYDESLSDAFFDELAIPEPDRHLGVGSASHAEQTARVMTAFEPVFDDVEPDLVVVVGDVNSTVATALVAAKKGVPVAHVEAGLRSGDMGMPEEINRVLTDRLSSLLLTPSPDADENLRREGIEEDRIHRVGNIMIDTLLDRLPRARELDAPAARDLEPGGYALATLHRPSNVDDPEQLGELVGALDEVAARLPLFLPLHPRTRKNLDRFGLAFERARVTGPIPYLEFLGLMADAALVLTDSGGIQEETTVLGVPCLTLRPHTERPITITEGTNRLVTERTRERIVAAVDEVLSDPPETKRPELWDGRTGERIAGVIEGWWEDGGRGL